MYIACIYRSFPCLFLDLSTNANDWVEVFDCNPPGGNFADRQLVTRTDAMKAMQTAYAIAICDNGASPHKWEKCVFAKRGTEPFNNLAKGHVINGDRESCDVDCLSKWWIGDAERIGRMTFRCRAEGASDYTVGGIYHACGNGDGLHMSANENSDRCGWTYIDEAQDMPSVWIQRERGKDTFVCLCVCLYGYVYMYGYLCMYVCMVICVCDRILWLNLHIAYARYLGSRGAERMRH